MLCAAGDLLLWTVSEEAVWQWLAPAMFPENFPVPQVQGLSWCTTTPFWFLLSAHAICINRTLMVSLSPARPTLKQPLA
jgi:hypothetical protein